jgi:hypothetical protein
LQEPEKTTRGECGGSAPSSTFVSAAAAALPSPALRGSAAPLPAGQPCVAALGPNGPLPSACALRSSQQAGGRKPSAALLQPALVRLCSRALPAAGYFARRVCSRARCIRGRQGSASLLQCQRRSREASEASSVAKKR